MNTATIQAYWQIARRIVEEEQRGERRAGYGEQLVRNLARALADEFGKGMSADNLFNFRPFHLTFPGDGKFYALRRELTWTHWRLLMRVENPDAREYYLEEAARQQVERPDTGQSDHHALLRAAAEGSGRCRRGTGGG